MPGSISRPFADTSIWNTRIGTGAAPVHAQIPAPVFINPERDIIVLTPAEPARQVWENGVFGCAGPGDLCDEVSYTGLDVPVPDDFVVPNECPFVLNNSAAFLLADGVTVKEFQPAHRCTAAGRVTCFEGDFISTGDIVDGDGIFGSHGGSSMSALGGCIRPGELVPGADIEHALKILLDGRSLSSTHDGFRWPAAHADSGFEDLYTGIVPACRMGALLHLLPTFDVDALNTEPAQIIARTLQQYGCYVVDLRADETNVGMAISREPNSMGGDAYLEFADTWGFDFSADTGPWFDDMVAIFTALHVVDNNSESNIGGGGGTVASVFQFEAGKVATQQVIVGTGTVLNRVKSISYSFRVATVPTATIVLNELPPGAVAFNQDIRVYLGFNGLNLLQFTGRIIHVNTNEHNTVVECSGRAFWLDVPYRDVLLTIQNISNSSAITTLLQGAGIPDFTLIGIPAWQMGTVDLAPQSDDVEDKFVTLEFETTGEAIMKIGEPDGIRWMETATGTIIVTPLRHIPAVSPWRTYFSMHLNGDAEEYPTGVTVGRPQIRNVGKQQRIRDVKNRVIVSGATIQQVNDDGTADPIPITGVAQANSPWIKNFDGSAAYNTLDFQHELIDTLAKASETAFNEVLANNRLFEDVSLNINGDPELALARTVRVLDPDYSRIDARYFIEGYTTTLDVESGTFESSLELIGGPDAGSAIDVLPFALFQRTIDREVIGDRVWAIITVDCTGSYDFDGEVVSYHLEDSEGYDVTQTSPVFYLRVDPDAATLPYQITLEVEDDDGNVSLPLTLTVGLTPADTFVVVPAEFVANDAWFSASPDGGITWNDQPGPGGDSVISTGTKPPNGIDFGIGIFGTELGAIYRTDDFCATPPTQTLAPVGSPMVHTWPDLNHLGTFWGLTRDGRVFRSDNDGVDWALHDDLRIVFNRPNLIANRIATPAPDGVWVFGGEGNGQPLICHDFDRAHHWNKVPIDGELLAACNAAADPSLYVADAGNSALNDLAVILNSASLNAAVYYTLNSLNATPAWKAAQGAVPAKSRGTWLMPNLGAAGAGAFQFGYNDADIYLGDDLTGSGILQVAVAPTTLDVGDTANHGLAIGAFIGGIGGAHMVAAEGAADGTLYKTWDRFGQIGKHRPAAGFPAAPAGANSKMINISAAGFVQPQGLLYFVGGEGVLCRWDDDAGLWVALGAGGLDPANSARRLIVLPGGFLMMYGGNAVGGGSLYWSLDGSQWDQKIAPRDPGTFGRNAGVIDVDVDLNGRVWACDGDDDSLLSAATEQDSNDDEWLRIWYSDDDGFSWNLAYEDLGWTDGAFINVRTGIDGFCCDLETGAVLAFANTEHAGHPRLIYSNDQIAWVRRTAVGELPNSGGANNSNEYRSGTGGRVLVSRRGAVSDTFLGAIQYTDDRAATNWSYGSPFSSATRGNGWTIGPTRTINGERRVAICHVGRDLPNDWHGLYKSDDNGDTWTLVHEFDADDGDAFASVEYDPYTDTAYCHSRNTNGVEPGLWKVVGVFDASPVVTDIRSNIASLVTDNDSWLALALRF